MGPATLLRTPGFSLTAILVMALGIGATTSLFTIVRSVLLKPLPFRDPDKLVMLYEHFRQNSRNIPITWLLLLISAIGGRKRTAFRTWAAWRWWAGHISTVQGELPEVAAGAGGSWNLFSVLGVQPVLGRTFTPDEDRFGANDVVMLSWSLFQSRFSGDKTLSADKSALIRSHIRLLECCRHGLPIQVRQLSFGSRTHPPYASDTLESHDRHQSFVVAGQRIQSALRLQLEK